MRLGPLVDRYGTPRIFAVSAASSVVGYALILRLGASPDYVAVILPTIVLLGIGFMLGFPSLNMQATNGIADHEQGLASGLVQSSFQIGGAIGLAVVSAIVTSKAGTSTDPGVLLDAYQTAIAVTVGIAALGLAVALSGVVGLRREVLVTAER